MFVPGRGRRGLQLRVDKADPVPVQGAFGWVPSACIDVDHPIRLQYSLNTIKFKFESRRFHVRPDGTCTTDVGGS